MGQQVAHAVKVTIVRRCPRCGGTGRVTSDKDTSTFRDCPNCHGVGDSNEEIPLDDLYQEVAYRIIPRPGGGLLIKAEGATERLSLQCKTLAGKVLELWSQKDEVDHT